MVLPINQRDTVKLGGIFSGLGAAIAAMEMNLVWACILIVIAWMFDMLACAVFEPGSTDEALNQAFDHLSELIPFSVAPGIMVFAAFRMPVVQGGAGWPAWAAGCLAITPALFGCIRAARDYAERPGMHEWHRGLPRAVFALYIATMLTSHLLNNRWMTDAGSVLNPVVYGLIATIILSASLLTLTRRPYHPRPGKSSRWVARFSFGWFLLTSPLGLAVGLIIGEPRLACDVLFCNLSVYVWLQHLAHN